MSEYEQRGRAPAYASRALVSQPPEPSARSSAERARDLADDKIVSFERAVGSLAFASAAMHAATTANDLEKWRDARARFESGLRQAERERGLSHARVGDATPEIAVRFASAARALDEHSDAAASSHAPLGRKTVSREGEILAILRTKVERNINVEWARNEAALRFEIDQLSPAEARTLAVRIEREAQDDPLTAALKLMTPERGRRVLAYLKGARAREARRSSPQIATSLGPTTVVPEPAPTEGSVETAAQPARESEANHVVTAARGVAGGGSAMPHLAPIQRSFGRHDITGVQAHVGGAAAEASRAIGARGYTMGSAVAFDGVPDLHTAAHEAAHVVQQRSDVALEGDIDEPGDLHEHQADRVADAVVRGESAERLLDGIAGGTSPARAVVQRKAGQTDTPVHAAAEQETTPATVQAPHAKYAVFAETGQPFKIVSARDPVRFWVVRDWISAGAGFKRTDSTHAHSPACATELLGALGWVRPDRIATAAEHMTFDISRRVAETEVAASAFYFTGMPSAKPVMSRPSQNHVQLAIQLADPDVPANTQIKIDDDQRLAMIRALASYTGLEPVDDAVAKLRADQNFQSERVQSGVVLWDIGPATGDAIFGFDVDAKHGGRYSQWLHAKPDRKPADATASPKLKLDNYYQRPVPGQLTIDRELVEAGTPVWLQVPVKWPSNYPSSHEYDVVPMVTPGYGGNVSLLTCAWSIEPSDGSGARTVTSGTSVGELHHAFTLPEGRESGTFKITVHAQFPEYFEPATFERVITVKSTTAAMQQLGDEAFGDLCAQQVVRTPAHFDVRGSGDDKEGSRTSGQLPATFVPSALDAPDPRAAGRIAERKRLEAVRMYLQARDAKKEVLDAIDRELAASRATETALETDRMRGFQPFQIRGTFLSRTDGVPSGALTLYGSVRTAEVRMEKGGFVRGGIVVQVRDLSRRFDNTDMMSTGIGETFEEALKSAFLDSAKAYPTGVVEIEAEAIDAAVSNGKGEVGKPNGRTLGFQLGTDSMWKRAKGHVFSPIANLVTNLAAMALMAFVPGSAAIVAPLLIAYNTTPTLDRLRTDSERGTLSFATIALSVGEIALNLLPFAGKAKPFTKGWFVLETANWGGQAVLLAGAAVQAAHDIQAQDAEALAALYEEMQKLEASGADPAAIDAKRLQVIERAKQVSERIEEQITEQVTRFALLAVAGSVIHRAGSPAQRARLIDDLDARRSGSGTVSPHPPTEHSTGVVPTAPLGDRVADLVGGVRYHDGEFTVSTQSGDKNVQIKRTGGTAQLRGVESEHVVLEVPRGLADADFERVVVGKLTELRELARLTRGKSAQPASGLGEHGADFPAHTPYGEVWPGEVPDNAPPAQRKVFEAAKHVYEGLKKDGFQGAAIGRIRWEHYLVEHGIPVDGGLRDGGRHAIHEVSPATRPPTPSDLALPRDPTVGARSANTGHVNKAQCLSALDEILRTGSMLEGAHRNGETVRVKLADGSAWTIKIAEPMPTHADEMAALAHGENGDTVWVSDTLTNEQIPRALGAIIGESLAATGRHGGNGARFGELDAMLAHRDRVAAEPVPETPRNATPAQVKAHALAASRAEATARIDAEIDLVLHRMGLDEPGPRRDEQLAGMPADLAAKVRARLAQHVAVGFRPDGIRPENAVARPGHTPEKPLGVSEVLPDAPAGVHPYTEADRSRVLELRVELEAIREIDARTAHRDRPGTNGGTDIAKGETQRRADHVARARELMAELQLGGDTGYLKERLNELAAVFPGIERDVVPAIEQRAQRRDVAAAKHHEAEAFRVERTREMHSLVARIKGMKVITTSRLVVGDGFSGLADIATLGTEKQGAWIDPSELLVIGNPDLVARLAEADPLFRWGQRAAAYDRPIDAHPAFSDASGRGTGELTSVVEDPGEFLHVGETRDAMDLARKRLGVVAVPGEVQRVETAAEKDPGSPPWALDPAKYPVRTRVVIDGQERFVYAEHVDLTTGPGKPRVPNEAILSKEDRQTLSGAHGEGPLFSGEKILEGRDVRGKRVLVLAFGPTGAWVAKVAADRGAARVDFAGGTGGELGTGGRIRNKPGQRPEPRGETAGNDTALQNNVASLDRLQDVANGSANVHITLDRIIHIEPSGEGAIVTYAHGPGETAEVYQVEYDAIATTMGFSTAQTAHEMVGEPTVKEMVGNMGMIPQRGTDAPVLEDAKTGRVRVLGFAAGDGVNTNKVSAERGQPSPKDVFDTRRANAKNRTSADSPDDRVVEGAGTSARQANHGRNHDDE